MKEEVENRIAVFRAVQLLQIHLDTSHSSQQLQIMEVEKVSLLTMHQMVGITIQFQAIRCIYPVMELMFRMMVNMEYDLEVESLQRRLFLLLQQPQLLRLPVHTHHPLRYHLQHMDQHLHQQDMIILFQLIRFNTQHLHPQPELLPRINRRSLLHINQPIPPQHQLTNTPPLQMLLYIHHLLLSLHILPPQHTIPQQQHHLHQYHHMNRQLQDTIIPYQQILLYFQKEIATTEDLMHPLLITVVLTQQQMMTMSIMTTKVQTSMRDTEVLLSQISITVVSTLPVWPNFLDAQRSTNSQNAFMVLHLVKLSLGLLLFPVKILEGRNNNFHRDQDNHFNRQSSQNLRQVVRIITAHRSLQMWLILLLQQLRRLLHHLLLQDPLVPPHLVDLHNHLALDQRHLPLVDQHNHFALGPLHHNGDLLLLLADLSHLEDADLSITNKSQMLFHQDSHLQLYQMGPIQLLKAIIDFLKATEMCLADQMETKSILYLDRVDLLGDQATVVTGYPTMELTGPLQRSTDPNPLDPEDLLQLTHGLLTLEDPQYPGLNQLAHQDHQVSGHRQVIQEMEPALIHLDVAMEETVSLAAEPTGHLLHLTGPQVLVLAIVQIQTLMDLVR